MIVDKITVGKMHENCYIAVDEETKRGIIVDPGDEAEKIENELISLGVKLEGIILTHCHFDHVGAVDEIKAKHPEINIYVNEIDYEYVKDDVNWPFGKFNSEVTFIEENKEFEVGPFKFKTIFTPGHSKGSVCFLGNNILFSGDTLFRETVGRTDLIGSSYEEILDSVNNKLMLLDDNVEVYPGHGHSTTIKHERHNNPFVL